MMTSVLLFFLSTSTNHKVRLTCIKNEARAEVWDVNIRKPQQIKAKMSAWQDTVREKTCCLVTAAKRRFNILPLD